MVKSFRVSDLQTLLASMGRSKSGLKQDLVGRALRLVQTEYSPELLKNVRQLYESRFPKASGWLPARRPDGLPVPYTSLSSSTTTTSQGTDYLNGISKPLLAPRAEVKLTPLPFYQTLETLLPPTDLSTGLLLLSCSPVYFVVVCAVLNGFCPLQFPITMKNYKTVSASLN